MLILPFQYRRRIKILPGIHLNLGKKSHSWSFGGRGAHTTYNPKTKKVTQSMDLPGGLSWRKQYSTKKEAERAEAQPAENPEDKSGIATFFEGIGALFSLAWALIKLAFLGFIAYEVIYFVILMLK
ncbi:MAG: DUF4236 domain-containing protein [Sporolactobacillus sp.]